MPTTLINLVEPTLMTEAGHCFSFVDALCRAAEQHPSRTHFFRVWANRRAEVELAGSRVELRRHFSRRWRRPQSFLLYRRLLRSPGKLFIATAGRTDLLMLDWAASGEIPPGKVYLYFHWFNSSEKKLATIRKIAAAQPNLVIFGPTPSVIAPFLACGFRHARVVPYPISLPNIATLAGNQAFRHLLYAGAARHDKGFSPVVDLVAYLHAQELTIPITLQIAAEHFGKYDVITQGDIRRLKGLSYPALRLLPETLGVEAYREQFAGAICIQLYDQQDFADRISGVTLDAFTAGCPIVTTPGTWMARMADERFGAGVVVSDTSAATVLGAIQSVMSEYPRFQERALHAGHVLGVENSAGALYQALIDD